VTELIDALVTAPLQRDPYRLVHELPRDVDALGLPDEDLRVLLAQRLRVTPDLVGDWQGYSWDKRWSSPYLDGTTEGLYDSGYRDVVKHPDHVSACAAFIVRELAWMRERRRADPGRNR
jgi:hypothetical protein